VQTIQTAAQVERCGDSADGGNVGGMNQGNRPPLLFLNPNGEIKWNQITLISFGTSGRQNRQSAESRFIW
jgi:hypothetical protein